MPRNILFNQNYSAVHIFAQEQPRYLCLCSTNYQNHTKKTSKTIINDLHKHIINQTKEPKTHKFTYQLQISHLRYADIEFEVCKYGFLQNAPNSNKISGKDPVFKYEFLLLFIYPWSTQKHLKLPRTTGVLFGTLIINVSPKFKH